MIALLCALFLGAGDLGRAERAYRAGQYGEALTLFQAALDAPGAPQGPLLYNLGNCAYRLGRHAEAVLYYRRAQLRLPRDPELEFNLRLTERRLGVDAPVSESFVAAFFDSFTPSALLWLVGGLQGVGLVGLVLLRRRRAARFGMALLVLLALAGAARLAQTQWFPGPPSGVVLASEISLRSAPRADRAVTLELEAGETVRVQESSERWIRVVHARGSGWTERAGVGVVD